MSGGIKPHPQAELARFGRDGVRSGDFGKLVSVDVAPAAVDAQQLAFRVITHGKRSVIRLRRGSVSSSAARPDRADHDAGRRLIEPDGPVVAFEFVALDVIDQGVDRFHCGGFEHIAAFQRTRQLAHN